MYSLIHCLKLCTVWDVFTNPLSKTLYCMGCIHSLIHCLKLCTVWDVFTNSLSKTLYCMLACKTLKSLPHCLYHYHALSPSPSHKTQKGAQSTPATPKLNTANIIWCSLIRNPVQQLLVVGLCWNYQSSCWPPLWYHSDSLYSRTLLFWMLTQSPLSGSHNVDFSTTFSVASRI